MLLKEKIEEKRQRKYECLFRTKFNFYKVIENHEREKEESDDGGDDGRRFQSKNILLYHIICYYNN